LKNILEIFAFGIGNEEDDAIAKDKQQKPLQKEQVILNLSPNQIDQPASVASNKKVDFLMLLICIVGLQTSFLSWGVLQERIIQYNYERIIKVNTGDGNVFTAVEFDKFRNTQFLVFINRFAGLVLSSLIMIITNKYIFFRRIIWLRKIVSVERWAPFFICSYSSLSNVVSSWFQYEALKYVSFTTQLLAKSSKTIFVMLTGRIVSKKVYRASEYVCVCIITLGIFMFSEVDQMGSEEGKSGFYASFPGLLCLLGYLISDSFTSTWQENLNKSYKMSSMSLMFMTNLYSCLFTFISLLYRGQFFSTFTFINEHSDVFNHIVWLSMASAIGQVFIFITIQKFGAFVFSLVMTTRQIIAVVLSSLLFQHSMSLQSCFGVFLVFFGVLSQQLTKFFNKPINNPKRNLLLK
jgi:solute carrier family 35 (adenosine 3'-phospho 5'-phosphosulfate transporter), member B2